MSSPRSSIKCIIVDDEPLAQSVLQQYIAQYPELELMATCDDAQSAFAVLHTHPIDVLFLDINMPRITGLDFLKSLSKPPLVIFTTAYAEYALEGFELDAVDYLMKPVAPDRFAKAIEKLHLRMNKAAPQSPNPALQPKESPTQKSYMFVKTDGKLQKIIFNEILYCEGMRDYIKIHLKNNSFVVIHQTMKGLEDQLPDQFMRVHKSFIVFIPAIKAIADNMILFTDSNQQIPISATYKEDLMSKLI